MLDNGFFHFTLLIFIHSTLTYCVVRLSTFLPFNQFDLKAFIYNTCCFMVIFLGKCISYIDHLKAFVDPNPRDVNREQALKRNMVPSSFHTHTIVQGGQNQNIGVFISLDPHSPRSYLKHQNICREDDAMHFIHDLSPHIILSKYEALDDKDISSQSTKEDMHDEIKEESPSQDITSSSTNPFIPYKHPYTTNFK